MLPKVSHWYPTMRLKRVGIFLAALALSSLPGGCTYTVPIDPTLPRRPLVERLPVMVGVHYSEDFRSFEYRTRYDLYSPFDHTYRFPLGAASVALFDQILASLFEEVKPVDHLPPLSPKKPEISAVIQPKISAVSAEKLDLRSVTIEYEIGIYAPDGAKVASWKVEGFGRSDMELSLIKTIAGDATQKAMRDVGTRVLSSFFQDPDVKAWFDKAGATSRTRAP